LELISALADGELSADEAERARAHIAGCERCRALYELYTQASLTLSGAGDAQPPDSLAKSVLAAVETMDTPRADVQRSLPQTPRLPSTIKPSVRQRPARRRSNLPRLLPVACLAVLLFALHSQNVKRAGTPPSSPSSGSVYAPRPSASAPQGEAEKSAAQEDGARNGGLPDTDYNTSGATPQASPHTPGTTADDSMPAPEANPTADNEDDMHAMLAPGDAAEIAEAAGSGGGAGADGADSADGADADGTVTGTIGVDDAGAVYATLTVTGELPELLFGKSIEVMSDGTLSMLISRDEADALIALGYTAAMPEDGELSAVALVIYEPLPAG
jgi:anti-sigma factor RsiW